MLTRFGPRRWAQSNVIVGTHGRVWCPRAGDDFALPMALPSGIRVFTRIGRLHVGDKSPKNTQKSNKQKAQKKGAKAGAKK